MSTSSWPHSRAPTVNDLKTKRCWICLGESDEPESDQPQARGPDRWIHPCSCSLIAHESCLLTWIESAEDNATLIGSSTIKTPQCPQCATKYIIRHASKTPLLRFLNRGHAITSTVYSSAGVVVGLGSIVFVAASYGGIVLRLFLGQEAFSVYFGESFTDWLRHSLDFTVVPITLLLPDSLFDTVIPITFPFVMIPLILSDTPHVYSEWLTFPPPPTVTLFMWPHARVMYNRVWGYIVRRATGRDYSTLLGRFRQDLEIMRLEAEANENARARVVEGAAEIRLVVEHAPAAGDGRDLDVPNAVPENREPNGEDNRPAAAPLANANANANQPGNVVQRVVTLTFGIMARYVLSSLAAPFVGQLVGRGLYVWSTHDLFGSNIMRTILGLRLGNRRQVAIHLPVRSSGTVFAGLGLAGLLPFQVRPEVGDLDPVWWRNTLGMAAYMLATDMISLLHLWLALRERRLRRVVDRSFKGVDYSSLDLVETST